VQLSTINAVAIPLLRLLRSWASCRVHRLPVASLVRCIVAILPFTRQMLKSRPSKCASASAGVVRLCWGHDRASSRLKGPTHFLPWQGRSAKAAVVRTHASKQPASPHPSQGDTFQLPVGRRYGCLRHAQFEFSGKQHNGYVLQGLALWVGTGGCKHRDCHWVPVLCGTSESR
jgi:hypothetical protein